MPYSVKVRHLIVRDPGDPFRLQPQWSNKFSTARSQSVAMPRLSAQNHFEDGIILSISSVVE